MKLIFEVPALFNIIVISLFLFNLQGCRNVTGQFEYDFMDLNLEEDVAKPTAAGCGVKKRSVKRSANDSLLEQNVTARNASNETVVHSTLDDEEIADFVDDCLVWPFTCPDEVTISWLQAAPFVYDARISDHKSGEYTPAMKGVFHEVVTRAIGVCCKTFAGTIPQVRFLKRAPNLRVLHRDLIHGLADMIIPVHSDEEKYGGSLPYVKILDSPGVVLIVPDRHSHVKEWKVVLKAVLGTWPVVLMAFLMSSVAGVFIWALVSRLIGWLINLKSIETVKKVKKQ